MKSNIAFFVIVCSFSLAHAASVSFEGYERTSGQECGISYGLTKETGVVSDVRFYHGSSVISVQKENLINERSMFGGFTKLMDAKESGPYPGQWSKFSLKVYGDLATPSKFKYDYSSGRIMTGNSTTIDCI